MNKNEMITMTMKKKDFVKMVTFMNNAMDFLDYTGRSLRRVCAIIAELTVQADDPGLYQKICEMEVIFGREKGNCGSCVLPCVKNPKTPAIRRLKKEQEPSPDTGKAADGERDILELIDNLKAALTEAAHESR